MGPTATTAAEWRRRTVTMATTSATTREMVDPVSAAATPCASCWLAGAPPDPRVAVTKMVVVTAMPSQPPT